MAGLCSRRCLAIFSVNQHSTRPISTRDQDRVLDSDLQDQEQEQEQDSYWMEPVRHMNLLIAGEAPRNVLRRQDNNTSVKVCQLH